MSTTTLDRPHAAEVVSARDDETIYLHFYGQRTFRAVAVAVVSEFRRGDLAWGEWRVYLGGCPATEEPDRWVAEPFTAASLPPAVRLVKQYGTKVSEEIAQHMFPYLEQTHPTVAGRYAL